MRSVIGKLDDDRYARLRVGIGRPETDAVRHVLGPFTVEERPLMDRVVAEAADAVWDWLVDGDVQKTMSRFHSRWTPDVNASLDT